LAKLGLLRILITLSAKNASRKLLKMSDYYPAGTSRMVKEQVELVCPWCNTNWEAIYREDLGIGEISIPDCPECEQEGEVQ